MSKLLHYHLFCVELTFVDSEGNTGITRVNTLAEGQEQFIQVQQIGRAQQAAQAQFFEKLGEVVTILNVVIISTNYLGQMTKEKFYEGADALKNETVQ